MPTPEASNPETISPDPDLPPSLSSNHRRRHEREETAESRQHPTHHPPMRFFSCASHEDSSVPRPSLRTFFLPSLSPHSLSSAHLSLRLYIYTRHAPHSKARSRVLCICLPAAPYNTQPQCRAAAVAASRPRRCHGRCISWLSWFSASSSFTATARWPPGRCCGASRSRRRRLRRVRGLPRSSGEAGGGTTDRRPARRSSSPGSLRLSWWSSSATSESRGRATQAAGRGRVGSRRKA
jgi:hypothetical protein